MKGTAVISNDEKYRYLLTREWDDGLAGVCFLLLNPSTADAIKDDPTIRRCIGFARQWGFGYLDVVNLFAYRATSPSGLWRIPDPIGPENDAYIAAAVLRASLVVAAWGTHGELLGRGDTVAYRLRNAKCLGMTKNGEPRHPLYLDRNTPLIEFGTQWKK